MRTLTVNSKLSNYNVVISNTAVDEMEKYIKIHHAKATIFVIYDPSVRNIKQLIKFKPLIFIPLPKKKDFHNAAEEIKNWKTATNLIRDMFDYDVTKNSLVIAVGGGVTTDIVGFVSTIVLRGISCIYCPTTLVCSVNACIGGETGINYNSLKNIIGTLKNPNAVFIDLRFLKNLPTWAIQDGLCDCIKHALIYDEGLLYFIKDNHKKIYNKNNEVWEELIYRNLVIKRTFLTEELYDKRIALSLGHTVFNALETKLQLGHLTSLPLGIIVACRIANKMNLLNDEDLKKIDNLMSYHFNLEIETDRANVIFYILQSIMKNSGQRSNIQLKQQIKMVLPVGIGKVEIHAVSIKLLTEVLNTIFLE